MSLSSRDLNYLIWRYLQESGFELSTYALQKEANAHLENDRLESAIASGTLVDLVQKGIQFHEVESAIRSGKSLTDAPFTLVGALATYHPKANGAAVIDHQPHSSLSQLEPSQQPPPQSQSQSQLQLQSPPPQKQQLQSPLPQSPLPQSPPQQKPTPLHLVYSGTPATVSQWHPKLESVVAFGTGSVNAFTLAFEPFLEQPAMLPLPLATTLDLEKDVTALSWQPTGSLIALGSFDGSVKLVTADAKLRHVLSLHTAPIMSLKWNSSGSLLASVDCTNTIIIWNSFSGDAVQQFERPIDQAFAIADAEIASSAPQAGTLVPASSPPSSGDADWIDDETYAVTGESNAICVYKVSDTLVSSPLLRFKGHHMAINVLTFDPTTKLLASGSDDSTIKIWHGKSLAPIITLSGHTAPVLSVIWRPVSSIQTQLMPQSGAGSAQVVSASLDGTVRLWDTDSGQCTAVYTAHEGPIFACALSPNGKYAASGGVDGKILVWDLSSAITSPVYVYDLKSTTTTTNGDKSNDNNVENGQAAPHTVATLSWSCDSRRIFASFESSSLVLDMKNN